MSLVAHAGEEILYVLAPALVFLAVFLVRANRERRKAEGGGEAVTDGACPYCGGPIVPTDERCPRCGFKIRRKVGGA